MLHITLHQEISFANQVGSGFDHQRVSTIQSKQEDIQLKKKMLITNFWSTCPEVKLNNNDSLALD